MCGKWRRPKAWMFKLYIYNINCLINLLLNNIYYTMRKPRLLQKGKLQLGVVYLSLELIIKVIRPCGLVDGSWKPWRMIIRQRIYRGMKWYTLMEILLESSHESHNAKTLTGNINIFLSLCKSLRVTWCYYISNIRYII